MKIRVSKIVLVIERELWQTVFTKGFLLAIFFPVLFLFLIASMIPLAEKLINRSKNLRTEPLVIQVIGSNPGLVEVWNERLADRKLPDGRPYFDLKPAFIPGILQEVLEKNARKNLFDKKCEAFIVITGDITKNGKCDFYTTRGFDLTLPRDLSRSLRDLVRNERLIAEGFNPERIQHLSRGITWNEFELSPEAATGKEGEGGKKRRARFEQLIAPAIICMMIMFFLTFCTSQMLLRGIVEEKTSRVIEVLLSSLYANELFIGKVIGFYLIGLIQFLCWTGTGIGFMMFYETSITDYVPLTYFLNYMIFLTTGYLFYAATFASIGAIVTDETESQQFQAIFTIINVIPMMMYFVFITQPHWWVVRAISFIPFFSHSVMALRMVAAPIPWWEITLVALSSLTFAVLVTMLGTRIFRIGILMTGKRPTLREVWRWCRYRDTNGVIEARYNEL